MFLAIPKTIIKRQTTQMLRSCAIGMCAVLILSGAMSNCSKNEKKPNNTSEGHINIIVSILPQQYFVKAIGGDRVRIKTMVEKGANPATYEPKPEQMKAIEEADAYIAIGVPFENVWLKKFERANNNLQLFHQDQSIEKINSDEHDHDDASAEKNTTTDQGDTGNDPHIWLSVKRAPKQAENIYNILSELDPANEAVYRNNYETFLTEITKLDEQLTSIFSETRHKEFLVYHPAFGYIANDFGLTQIPIELEGKEPSTKELEELIKLAENKQISTIFAEDQFDTKSAKAIASHIHGNVVTLDPLSENWNENMKHIAEEIACQRIK